MPDVRTLLRLVLAEIDGGPAAAGMVLAEVVDVDGFADYALGWIVDFEAREHGDPDVFGRRLDWWLARAELGDRMGVGVLRVAAAGQLAERDRLLAMVEDRAGLLIEGGRGVVEVVGAALPGRGGGSSGAACRLGFRVAVGSAARRRAGQGPVKVKIPRSSSTCRLAGGHTRRSRG